MADWFVRPDGTHNTTRNGLSYDTAWGGWDAITWSSLAAGDTLYVCGTYNRTYAMQMTTHGGTSSASVTIRGDYASAPATINFTSFGYIDVSQAWTTVRSLNITTSVTSEHVIHAKANGVRVIGCTINGGAECIHLASSVIPTLFEVTDCHLSSPQTAAIGYTLTTASSTASGITISGNLIHDSNLYGIYVTVSGAAGTTSYLNDVKFRNNEIYNTVRSTILFTGTTVDAPSIPTIYSGGLEITGNYVHDSGTVAGDNGTHGGIHVTGSIGALISGNRVEDCYATGAGIQTLRNFDIMICFNRVSGIRSGSPTSQYQNGLPIDGNGIFFDNGTRGGVAFGNHITDLVTTGNPGSGCGLSIWDCTDVIYYGNVVENAACGVVYGYATETRNRVYNNTFINCTVGVYKHSNSTPAGVTEVKNNILKNCTTGFISFDTNPVISNDYNCIYGSTTAYSKITAGANDLSINPDLDSEYRPRAVECKRSGVAIVGKDYYGKKFYEQPNIGAVDDISDTPRYFLKP